MLTYYHRTVRDSNYQTSFQNRRGAVGIIENASEADIQKMADDLGYKAQDFTDILDIQEIPRLEIEEDLVLLFVRSPLPLEDKQTIETQLFMMVYGHKKLYVVTNGKADLVVEILKSPQTATTQPTKLLVKLLLRISKKYSQYINEIAKRVDEKRKLLDKVTERDIEHLIIFEGILNEYISALSPMQRICTALTAKSQMGWFEEDKDLIEDLMNSMGQSADICVVNLKKILTLRDSFQIVYTNRLNQTLKVLTSVTIILTIPTMVASLFGMNVELPFDNRDFAFWIVLLGASGLALMVGSIFRLKKWM